MSHAAPAARTWGHWFRARERAFALAWLVASAAFLLVLLLPPARGALLGRLQSGVDWWDDRAVRRLAQAEHVLASGNAAGAARLLSELDQSFPARSVRHRRDKERERLLLRLGQAEAAAGHPEAALAAYARLVAFDSLNYLNHFEYGRALARLAGDSGAARRAYASFSRVLEIMPAHLPSVRGVLRYHLDRGELGAAVDAYERYLDAFMVHWVKVRFTDSAVSLLVQVDGRSQVTAFGLRCPAGCAGELHVDPQGFAFGLDSVVLVPGRRVGQARTGAPLRLAAADAKRLGADLAFEVPPQPDGVVRLKLGLRLFKPVEEALWQEVAESYRRTGRLEALAAAERRTVRQPTAAEADLVLLRLDWVRGGRLLRREEHAF